MSDGGGDDGGLVVDGLSDKLQDLGSEEGYLAASRKRADELKVQYVADEAEEERLAEMKASGEGGGVYQSELRSGRSGGDGYAHERRFLGRQLGKGRG